MRPMRIVLGAALALALPLASMQAQEKQAVQVKPAKLDELTRAIEAHKGKVVLVDFWSTTWLSCIKEFPHLVQMQKKLAGEGLVTISVSLDDLEEKNTQEKVQKFLTKQEATFTNFIMNEKSEVWQKKLDIGGPPAVMIYDRTGKLAKKFEEGEKPDEIEKAVREQLKKK